MAGRKRTHSEGWWTAGGKPGVRRCGAMRPSGTQCKREVEMGSVVCDQHGGLAPQVQRRAKERLIVHADRVVENLLRLIDDPETPMHLRIKVMQDWLDRAGVDKSQTVTIGTDPLEALFKQLTETPGALEEAHDDDLLELEAGAIYDAVVIEDDPLGEAFADAQRVVDPQTQPVDDEPVVRRMPDWMRKSYGNSGSDS